MTSMLPTTKQCAASYPSSPPLPPPEIRALTPGRPSQVPRSGQPHQRGRCLPVLGHPHPADQAAAHEGVRPRTPPKQTPAASTLRCRRRGQGGAAFTDAERSQLAGVLVIKCAETAKPVILTSCLPCLGSIRRLIASCCRSEKLAVLLEASSFMLEQFVYNVARAEKIAAALTEIGFSDEHVSRILADCCCCARCSSLVLLRCLSPAAPSITSVRRHMLPVTLPDPSRRASLECRGRSGSGAGPKCGVWAADFGFHQLGC